jgi:acid phosphatase class B
MPSNNDYLSKLATYNELHGITATFSEMKKTARRMQKLHDERGPVDLDAFFLLHSDPTGEEATDNVMAERAAQNSANAARRLSAA